MKIKEYVRVTANDYLENLILFVNFSIFAGISNYDGWISIKQLLLPTLFVKFIGLPADSRQRCGRRRVLSVRGRHSLQTHFASSKAVWIWRARWRSTTDRTDRKKKVSFQEAGWLVWCFFLFIFWTGLLWLKYTFMCNYRTKLSEQLVKFKKLKQWLRIPMVCTYLPVLFWCYQYQLAVITANFYKAVLPLFRSEDAHDDDCISCSTTYVLQFGNV